MNNVKSIIIGIQVDNLKRKILFSRFYYLAWPDQSCPDVAQPLIELIQHVENSRIELSKINSRPGPVVVHCRYIKRFIVFSFASC